MINSQVILERSLTFAYNNFWKSLDVFIRSLTSNDWDAQKGNFEEMKEKIDALTSILMEDDRPQWLKEIDAICLDSDDVTNFEGILNKLLNIYLDIKNYNWTSLLKGEKTTLLNIDNLYIKYKKEAGIEELFNDMIVGLEKIISSGEIDSIKILEGLKKLKNVLNQNKSGSYLSVKFSQKFIAEFFKNAIWEALEDIPGIKILVKALRKTVEKMNKSVTNVQNKIEKEAEDMFDISQKKMIKNEKKVLKS